MFPAHDPYHILIPSLARYWNYKVQLSKQDVHPQPKRNCDYCDELTDQLKVLLNGWRPYLQQVRDAYSRVPTNFDYNSRYQKGIYMLAYFPFYIEPIYYSLENDIEQISSSSEKKITISILGGGPLPELIGIVKLIDEKRNDIQNIHVKVFDKYESWVAEIENCTLPLLSNYYDRSFSQERMDVDLINLEAGVINDIIGSDIIILQNVINDISPVSYDLLKASLISIWKNMKKGSYFVVIDLNFNEVRQFMENLQSEFDNIGGEIISPLNTYPIEHRPNIPFCSHLEKLLFLNQSGLIHRRKVNYYRFVMKK